MLQLRRAQDLLSQMRKCSVTLEETLSVIMEEFVGRHDPVARAKRQQVKKGNPTASVKTPVSRQAGPREPIQAHILHQVNLRDQRRCTHTNSRGKKCNQTRFIEIHHIQPVSQGGTHALENLMTLCSAHHGWVHRFQSPQ
jgi:hypothetical protein